MRALQNPKTGFGELYAWGERLNRRIVIDTLLTSIVCDLSKYDKPSENPNLAMQSFFAMSDPEAFDFEDSEGDYLFERALNKFGPITENEMYGFVPMLPLGGSISLNNISKVDRFVHMHILSELGVANVPRFTT